MSATSTSFNASAVDPDPSNSINSSNSISGKEVDSKQSWVVVFGSFLSHFGSLGLLYSFSLFIKPYEAQFNASRSDVSLVLMLQFGCLMGFGLPAGLSADRYGVRPVVLFGACMVSLGLLLASFAQEMWHVTLSQGLMCGIGFSFVYWPSISVVPQWFDKYRGIGTGLATLGAGLGNLSSGQFVAYLLESGDFRRTLRMLSIYSFAILIVAALLLQRRLPPNTLRGNPFKENKDVIQTSTFKLLSVAAFFFQLGFNIPISSLAPFVEDQGLSVEVAALAVGALGIGTSVGRIAIGFAADCFGRLRTFKASMGATFICCVAWYFCTTQASVVAFSAMFGFWSGAFISLVPVVLAGYFDPARLGSVMGLISLSLIPGSFLGPILSGIMFDSTGSYLATCVFSSVVFGLCTLAMLPLKSEEKVSEDDGKAELNQV